MAEEKYSKKSISPIAYESVLERVGGDESFLEELLALYLEDFPQKMEQLHAAIAQKKFDLVRKLGHSLKGASSTLSLTFLQEASLQIETAGREMDIGKANKALAFLKQEFKRLLDFLAEKKAKSDSGS